MAIQAPVARYGCADSKRLVRPDPFWTTDQPAYTESVSKFRCISRVS